MCERKLQRSGFSCGLVLVMRVCVCACVHVCVCVCVEGVHREYHWAEFTHEKQQKMPQKYVRVPSYLCGEGREGTGCWEGSANFRGCLVFYLHLNPVVVFGQLH